MVPKKGGFTVIRNGKNELIPTRTVTEWRMCIDSRKLNSTIKKDHYPLPFINQMLDRLAGVDQNMYRSNFCYFYQRTVTKSPVKAQKTSLDKIELVYS